MGWNDNHETIFCLRGEGRQPPPFFLWLKAIKIEQAERSSSYLDTYRNNSHVFSHGVNQLEM